MLPTNNDVYEIFFMIWKHAYGNMLMLESIMQNYNCIKVSVLLKIYMQEKGYVNIWKMLTTVISKWSEW